MSRTRRGALGWTLPLALSCCLPAAAQEAPPEPTLALTGATVHPVNGPALEAATVLVRGGRIVALGAAGVVPEGATVVDLSGQHLYPGLIDAGTVLGLAEIGSVRGTRDDREIGRLNPNLRAELAVNPDSELLGVARTGGVLLAHVAHRGGLIAGRSALIYTEGWTHEDMTVRAPVFLHLSWPQMRLPWGKSPKELKEARAAREGALQAIREAFADARAHARAREAVGVPPPDADVKWEAMRDALQGTLPVAVEAGDLDQIEAALDWAAQERVDLVLMGGRDAWRCADTLAALDVPVILGPVFQLPRTHEALHTPFENPGRLHAAGVRLAFSTGRSSWGAANARNLRDHAAMAVAHGLPAAAALRALTLGAAEILGVDHRLGSIAVGKEATLIAVDGDLFAFDSRVTRAFIAGREVSLRDRQRALYERYRARPAPR